jgi:hypothetical protein
MDFENLFGTPNCKPSHGGCALETSYILWDKQNAHYIM